MPESRQREKAVVGELTTFIALSALLSSRDDKIFRDQMSFEDFCKEYDKDI